MKAMEGKAGQTGVSHSHHRKMALFLDCMVRERKEVVFAESCKSRNPVGSFLAGMGTPEVILQIKGEREIKKWFLYPPPPARLLAGWDLAEAVCRGQPLEERAWGGAGRGMDLRANQWRV